LEHTFRDSLLQLVQKCESQLVSLNTIDLHYKQLYSELLRKNQELQLDIRECLKLHDSSSSDLFYFKRQAEDSKLKIAELE
jgi:hypothetical protein